MIENMYRKAGEAVQGIENDYLRNAAIGALYTTDVFGYGVEMMENELQGEEDEQGYSLASHIDDVSTGVPELGFLAGAGAAIYLSMEASEFAADAAGIEAGMDSLYLLGAANLATLTMDQVNNYFRDLADLDDVYAMLEG